MASKEKLAPSHTSLRSLQGVGVGQGENEAGRGALDTPGS